MTDFNVLPHDLPVPVDDGAADHLPGTAMPALSLRTSDGKSIDVGALGGQQMERDALRALRTDAGQPAELVDQVLDRTFVHAAR